ncbi:MAG: phosphatidylserine decarboxylase family protein [Bacteroidetes bacterium]|nr:phosphatidylserine decarboxylase family protein [Bacteroidota bacterium]
MKFHKEGIPSLILTLIFIALINAIGHYFFPEYALVKWFIYLLSAFVLITILQFFRNPVRTLVIDDNKIIAPADGKVVVIEEVMESEYFKDKRRQISIFMSPINVHINRFPITGIVKYVKYHPGLFLVAWHPKSSTDNERTTVVVEHKNKEQVLFRQIAGAMARRIVYYCKENDSAQQGNEFGFIKFGSRVDIFLPLSCKVHVKLNEVTVGGQSVIAEF